jgi:GNAT superfamily N-acetyltransferase
MTSPEAPQPTEVLDRCYRSLVDGGWELSRPFGHARREEWPEGVALRSDLPSDLVNLLYLERTPSSLPEFVDRAVRFYGRRTPWRMIVRATAAPAVRAAASPAHLLPREAQPAMALAPIGPPPPPPPTLRIERVTNERQLDDYRTAVGRSFGIPRFIGRHTFPKVPDRRGPRPITFLVGYDRAGAPVATSAVVVAERVAGIYMVGTAPKARRRGYGAAMTWAAIDAGRADGADTAALNATAMGRPVYERMGFRVFDPCDEWSVPIPRIARWRATLALLSLAFRSPGTAPSA